MATAAEKSKPEPEEPTPAASPSSSKMRIEPLHASEDIKKDTATKPTPAAQTAQSYDDDGLKDETDEAASAEKLKAKQASEHDAEIEKLIDLRKYYLPINQVQRRRTKQLIWTSLIIVVLIGVAWTYALADAGIVTIPGFTPPTKFFR